MESFYDCVLPPTLAVYRDAVVASGHMATDVSFFKNKNPGHLLMKPAGCMH
ncbi:hypothetical protein GGI1_01279, partial [Acidithiobacillus sp. GGI-221]